MRIDCRNICFVEEDFVYASLYLGRRVLDGVNFSLTSDGGDNYGCYKFIRGYGYDRYECCWLFRP